MYERIIAITDLVPYSFNTAVFPETHTPPTPGQVQGVYITLHPDARAGILDKIIGWFTGREEIDLVDTGISDKVGLGYILLEWDECAIDSLFLAILRDEEVVVDYTTYTRDLEDYPS